MRRLSSELVRLHREVRDDAPRWREEAPLPDLPNILFIVSEDDGPELGCYGAPYVRTPVLDDLASRGVRFDRAFVPDSVCSPSRASFLTGLWPQQNGHLGLATHRFSLYEETASVPAWLKARGYGTGILGKLHVNPEENFPWDFRAIPSANFGKRDVREYAARVAYESFHRPSELELYDLRTDPHEFVNLAAVESLRATRERLFDALRAWQERIRGPLSDATLRAAFAEEQRRRREGSHRRVDFAWPYLERFRALA